MEIMFLTVKSAAKALSLSVETIYGLIKKGYIPYTRLHPRGQILIPSDFISDKLADSQKAVLNV
jgi:excisionase family DNA binding protein